MPQEKPIIPEKTPHAGTTQGATEPDGGDPVNTQQQQQGFSTEQANQLNRMFSEYRKRDEKKFTEMVTKAVSETLQTALSVVPPGGTTPPSDQPPGEIETKFRQELQTRDRRIADMEKAIQGERQLREQLEAKQKEVELLRVLRSEAVAQSVREEMLETLEAVTYFSPKKLLRRNEEGKPVFMAKSEFCDDLVEESVISGLKKFLKTSEGQVYLKPDVKPGSGLSPRKNGSGNSPTPKTTGLRSAKNDTEAQSQLIDYFSGKLED